MKTWKRQEIKAALELDGERVTKKYYGDSQPDIITWWGIGECKHKGKIPGLAFIKDAMAQARYYARRHGDKLSFVILHQANDRERYIVMEIKDFQELITMEAEKLDAEISTP